MLQAASQGLLSVDHPFFAPASVLGSMSSMFLQASCNDLHCGYHSNTHPASLRPCAFAGDARQQNILSALFANMKVSRPPNTPTALTPPPSIRPPSGSLPRHTQSQTPASTPPPTLKTPSSSLPPPTQQQPGLAASSPALLTPSFLRHRSIPLVRHTLLYLYTCPAAMQ